MEKEKSKWLANGIEYYPDSGMLLLIRCPKCELEEGVNMSYNIDDIKPYLRPISSMTKEEENEFVSFTDTMFRFGENKDLCTLPLDAIDWLLSKGFDIRDLIPKGLALEAPKDMYK